MREKDIIENLQREIIIPDIVLSRSCFFLLCFPP